MYIIMLGPPGSGKGTQGKILAQDLGLAHLSTGDLFRAILADESHPLYPEVQVVKEGKLVSDDVVNRVVESGLKDPQYAKGVLFDGYPRTTAQAEALAGILRGMGKELTAVIDLDVSREILLKRLLGRRVCGDCGKILHVKQGYTQCPACGGPVITRDDDNEETITKRFEEYREKTAPLQAYYQKSDAAYITLMINDEASPEEINDRIRVKMRDAGLR
jgi:adenylate kinase